MPPWDESAASSKTRKADTPARKKLWAKVANETLARTGDDARSIREANAALANSSQRAMNSGGRARRRMRKDPPIEIE